MTNLQIKLTSLKYEVSILETLLAQFPDLCEYNDLGKIYLRAKSANPQVTNFEFEHFNYDSYEGEPLTILIRPYVLVDKNKVYSDPHVFCIGYANQGNPEDKLWIGWQNQFIAHGFTQYFTNKIKAAV